MVVWLWLLLVVAVVRGCRLLLCDVGVVGGCGWRGVPWCCRLGRVDIGGGWPLSDVCVGRRCRVVVVVVCVLNDCVVLPLSGVG